jgi:hypothetical protein
MPNASVWSPQVSHWWYFLVAVSLLNIVIWSWLVQHVRRRDLTLHPAKWQIEAMVSLSAIYVFGCAFRAFLPRADVQKISLFGTWFSSVFVGRSVATVAELCFALQWALVLYFIARIAHSRFAEIISFCIVPLIACAEVFSWYAVITTDYFGNVLEESLWAVTFALVAAAFISLLRSFRGRVRLILLATIAGLVAYIFFMGTVDVPMYLGRWQIDNGSGKHLLNFYEGLKNLNTQWVVTRNIADWSQERAWMAFYFSAAVWMSLTLFVVTLFKDKLPRHLNKS